MQTKYTALQEHLEGRVRCLTCHTTPRIAWIDGAYALRCECWPKAPVLGRYNKDRERLGQMLEQTSKLAARTGNRTLETLTAKEVKLYLCPLATDTELEIFLRFCKAEGLNPFINEVYPIKYDAQGKMAIVVGYPFYLKRAGRHPKYAGYEAGVIVEDSAKRVVFNEGTFLAPGDVLRGGWCKVEMTGMKTPKHTVNLSEFSRPGRNGKNNWDIMPATMIQKVAVSQAHRLAVPEEFMGFAAAEGLQVLTDVEDARGVSRGPEWPFGLGDGDMPQDGWGARCPVHRVDWHTDQHGAHVHVVPSAPDCHRGKVLAPLIRARIDAAVKAKGWDARGEQEWWKATHDGHTWSTANTDERLAVMEELEAEVKK